MRYSLSLVFVIVGIVSLAVAPKPIRASPKKPYSPSKASEIDVTTCKHNEKYYIEHIQFICQHSKDVRALIPNGCYVQSHNTSNFVAIGSTWKDTFFVYKCQRENNSIVTYKAISCRLNNFELPLTRSLRTENVEYHCVQGIQGYVRIDVRWYLHSLCATGAVNQTDPDGFTACPGLAKSTIHSQYGFGSAVYYNSTKQVLIDTASLNSTLKQHH